MNMLIKNGTAVIGDSLERADIYVEGSKIVKIGKDIDCAADEVIEEKKKRVVFSELYRITDGLELLEKAGIEVVHIPMDK